MTGQPRLEVAEVLRSCDTEFRKTCGLSLDQHQVLSALIQCRTAALGGHVDECDQCGERRISYNSCRNRHCPKCQGSQAAQWLDAQRSHLLPVPYVHVVFTLPRLLAPLALQNRRTLYGLLFEAASQTLLEIAADPKHLGARVGFLALLHTWGQKLDHHPHLHCVVPAGGLSLDGTDWVACPPKFFLPVRVLSRVFRGKLLALLAKAFQGGKLSFHGSLESLAHETAFNRLLANAQRENNLARCRHHLGADIPTSGPAEPEAPPNTPAEAGTDRPDPSTSPCPVCSAGHMRRVDTLPCLRRRKSPPRAPREPP